MKDIYKFFIYSFFVSIFIFLFQYFYINNVSSGDLQNYRNFLEKPNINFFFSLNSGYIPMLFLIIISTLSGINFTLLFFPIFTTLIFSFLCYILVKIMKISFYTNLEINLILTSFFYFFISFIMFKEAVALCFFICILILLYNFDNTNKTKLLLLLLLILIILSHVTTTFYFLLTIPLLYANLIRKLDFFVIIISIFSMIFLINLVNFFMPNFILNSVCFITNDISSFANWVIACIQMYIMVISLSIFVFIFSKFRKTLMDKVLFSLSFLGFIFFMFHIVEWNERYAQISLLCSFLLGIDIYSKTKNEMFAFWLCFFMVFSIGTQFCLVFLNLF